LGVCVHARDKSCQIVFCCVFFIFSGYDVRGKRKRTGICLDAWEILHQHFLLQSKYGPKGFHFVKSLMKKGYLKFFIMGYIK
jgi:hypothetical protein